MVDDSGRVRQIAWLDVFPWLRLLKCPRLSLTLSLVVLALCGWLGMLSGWRFLGVCFSNLDDPTVKQFTAQFSDWPWEGSSAYQEPQLALAPPSYDTLAAASTKLIGNAKFFSAPVRALFDLKLSFGGFCFFLFCTLWTILVWSIFGAAITRIAALALTREHKLGLRGGFAFGLMHWPSFVGGPALPLAACLLLAMPLLVLGWIARLDSGAMFVSLIWPLALVGGGLIALLALGLALGWPLIWPTISTEATDSFDGLSRAYSYTLHRPLRYFGYILFAGILGTLVVYVASFVVSLILQMTLWGFSMGTGYPRLQELQPTPNAVEQLQQQMQEVQQKMRDSQPEFLRKEMNLGEEQFTIPSAKLVSSPAGEEPGAMLRGSRKVFAFWNHLLQLVPTAIAISYFWTAMTQIYLLLRRDEDGAELDEVFLPTQDKEFGLPPLKTDAAGVPSVAEPKPPTNSAPDDTALGSS